MFLLKQRVDEFELTISAEKLEAISNFQFSKSLKKLKSYLSLIEWLRQYVSYYAQAADSLQKWKTSLRRSILNELDRARKSKIADMSFDETKKEISTFNYLQEQFRKFTILTHFHSKLQLYADLNVSKVYDFDAIIYHILMKKICSILFLSRELNVVERNYWSTKLKVTDLVWVVRQVRHMIEFIKLSTILYTNHFATISIARQISLVFTNVNKLNLRLMRVSQCLSMFELNIWYKLNIRNIVFDALSRLLERCSESVLFSKDDEDIRKTLHICVWSATLVEMFSKFRKRLFEAFLSDAI